MLSTVIRLAEGAGEAGASEIPPILVGGVALVILLGLLIAVVAFGGGREHS